MCPRPKRTRKMNSIPNFKGFMPIGKKISLGEAIVLTFDEYEAIRLCDYEGLIHQEVAELMNVSRPTVTRIYESARKKLAQAIIEVKPIQIKGGQVILDGEWYQCKACKAFSTNPSESKNISCPICSKSDIIKIENIKDFPNDLRKRQDKNKNT